MALLLSLSRGIVLSDRAFGRAPGRRRRLRTARRPARPLARRRRLRPSRVQPSRRVPAPSAWTCSRTTRSCRAAGSSCVGGASGVARGGVRVRRGVAASSARAGDRGARRSAPPLADAARLGAVERRARRRSSTRTTCSPRSTTGRPGSPGSTCWRTSRRSIGASSTTRASSSRRTSRSTRLRRSIACGASRRRAWSTRSRGPACGRRCDEAAGSRTSRVGLAPPRRGDACRPVRRGSARGRSAEAWSWPPAPRSLPGAASPARACCGSASETIRPRRWTARSSCPWPTRSRPSCPSPMAPSASRARGSRLASTRGTSFEHEPFRRARQAAVDAVAVRPRRPPRRSDDGEPRGWIEAATLTPTEALYGGGETFQGPTCGVASAAIVNCETHGTGGVDASYLNVPFFWSDRGWGPLSTPAAPSSRISARPRTGSRRSRPRARARRLPADRLTVRVPLAVPITDHRLARPLPAWALGVWMSRCSYLSEQEILAILEELRRADCPVDVVHVDAWMERDVSTSSTCNWTIDRGVFPEGWVQTGSRDSRRAGEPVAQPVCPGGSAASGRGRGAGFLLQPTDGGFAEPRTSSDRISSTSPSAPASTGGSARVREVLATRATTRTSPISPRMIPHDAVFHGRPSVAAAPQRVRAPLPGGDPRGLADAAATQRCSAGRARRIATLSMSLGRRHAVDVDRALPSALRASPVAVALGLRLRWTRCRRVLGRRLPDRSSMRSRGSTVRSSRPTSTRSSLHAGRSAARFTPVYRFHGTARARADRISRAGRDRRHRGVPPAASSAALPRAHRRGGHRDRHATDAPDGARYPEAGRPRRGPAVPARARHAGGAAARAGAEPLSGSPPGVWSRSAGAPRLDGPGYVTSACATRQFPVWVRRRREVLRG